MFRHAPCGLVRPLITAIVCAAMCACGGLGKRLADSSPDESSRDTAGPATLATPKEPVAIEGSYTVTGSNPAGTAYRGGLEVIKHDQVYQFKWNAGTEYDGVGVQQDGVVGVSFCQGQDGNGCGVVCYRIEPDGTLTGRWGMWGTDDGGTEVATRTGGAGPLEGEYTTTGTNPGSSDYKGALSIRKADGGYSLSWSNGSTGFGIEHAGHLTAGYGGSRCGFVAYEIKADGSLEGRWGGAGSATTGSETAKKK